MKFTDLKKKLYKILKCLVKNFFAEFVYEICVGLTVYDFVFKDLSLSMVSKQYSMGLSEHYKDIHEDEMSVPAEDILRFMSEQKNPKFEAHDKANFFVHYRLKYDGLKGKRKLKGIFFGNALTGDKTKKYLYKSCKILKHLLLH